MRATGKYVRDSKTIIVNFPDQWDTVEIKDAAITNAKIGDLAVTNAKINDLSAAKITAGSLAVTYTDADVTADNPQTLGWITGTSGTLTISSTGKLAINVADALEIQAAGNVLVKQGGDIVMEGGASGNPSLIRFKDETVSGEIRFEQSGDAGNYWSLAKVTTDDMLQLDAVGITADLQLGTATNPARNIYNFYTGAFYTYDGATVIISAGPAAFSIGSRYVLIANGLHVGGTSDPGTDNLLVDGILTVATDQASNNAAQFTNSGNDVNRWGIEVLAGEYTETGTNYWFIAKDGDGHVTGHLKSVAGTFQLADVSDARLKQDITDTTISGCDVINNLRVRDFEFIANPGKVLTGFIAQEVNDVWPLAVGDPDTKTGLYSYSRDVLVVPVVKAIQEQQLEMEEQQLEMAKLDERLKLLEVA